jgi:hypothetical protein
MMRAALFTAQDVGYTLVEHFAPMIAREQVVVLGPTYGMSTPGHCGQRKTHGTGRNMGL